MSLSAQVVAELVAAGLAGQRLVEACRRIEAADGRAGATVAFARPDTATRNSRKNATVGEVQSATVAPGAGAGKAPLAMLRAAIANTSGLTRGAARVGAAILDRYDPSTGRCEIGVAAISRVCGLHRASVFRAVAALVSAGLFDRQSYGGMGHCNAYVPRLGSRVVEGAPSPDATVVAARPSQDCDPISERYISTSGVKGGAVRRKKRRFEPDRRQMHMPLPIAGGLSISAGFKPSPDAVREKATVRLWPQWIERHGGRLQPDPEAWEAAIQAEMRCHGSGMAAHDAYELGKLEQRRTGTGPPG